MANIINLRQVRKQKARRDRQDKASENAVKFGRTAGQKQAEAREAEKQRNGLDQTRLEMPPSSAKDDGNSP
ncbi:DUF4169 family protein [Marinovum sp. KMM 9879]